MSTRIPIEDWFARITELPGRTFALEYFGAQYAYHMDEIPDANYPGTDKTAPGSLYLDLDNPIATEREAILKAMTISIVTHLHEIAEWLRVDNERVFEPHYNGGLEWTVLEEIAGKAARAMLAKHPLNEGVEKE